MVFLILVFSLAMLAFTIRKVYEAISKDDYEDLWE